MRRLLTAGLPVRMACIRSRILRSVPHQCSTGSNGTGSKPERVSFRRTSISSPSLRMRMSPPSQTISNSRLPVPTTAMSGPSANSISALRIDGSLTKCMWEGSSGAGLSVSSVPRIEVTSCGSPARYSTVSSPWPPTLLPQKPTTRCTRPNSPLAATDRACW